MKAKEYFEKNSIGEFLLSNPTISDWWFNDVYATKEDYMKYTEILSDNRKVFTDLWGKQDFCVLDSGNRRCYVWNRKLNHGELWFITARERGTSIEWSNDSPEFVQEVKEYFGLVTDQLQEKI